MPALSNNSFILSHSQTSGYDFTGNIEKLIPDKDTQNWVASYISSLSEYASNPNYLSQDITTKSFFVKGDYVIFLEAYPKVDNRLFLERKITVASRKDNVDFNSLYESNQSVTAKSFDEIFSSKIKEYLLCAFLSENTTLYFLIDDSDRTEALRNMIFSFHRELLIRNSCVEVLGKIPPIKASAVTCRCVLQSDKTGFLNEIKGKSNYILVDLTSGTQSIEVSVSSPTYAQRAVVYLLEHYSFDFDNIYYSLDESLELNMHKIPTNSKTVFFNTIFYLTILNNFDDKIYEISMSAKEKEDINLMLNKGGLL